MKRLLALLLVMFVSVFVACSDDSEDNSSDASGDVSDVQSPGCTTGSTQLCACSTGDLGAQICADGAFGACDCTEPPTVGSVTFEVQDEDGSVATGIGATHIVGTTDCVQQLGTVEITNDTDESAEVSLATEGTLPQIVVAPASPITVDAGATTTVTLTFDCELLPSFPPDDITTTVTLSSAASPDDDISFPLSLEFQQ